MSKIRYDLKNKNVDYETIHKRYQEDDNGDSIRIVLTVSVLTGIISMELRYNNTILCHKRTVTMKEYNRILYEFYNIDNPEDITF